MSLEYPLTKANRIRLARAFKHVPRVDLSIECILEGQMGIAFVDDVQNPIAFKIEIGPFFYFAGDATSSGGHIMLKKCHPLYPIHAFFARMDSSSEGYVR